MSATTGTIDRLAYMANQIARNFAAMEGANAAVATADHIAHFWDPRMRALGTALLDRPDDALGDTARAALTLLRDRGAPPPQTRATAFAAEGEAAASDAG